MCLGDPFLNYIPKNVPLLYVLYFTKGFQGIKNHQKTKADTSQEHIEHLNTPPHLLTL